MEPFQLDLLAKTLMLVGVLIVGGATSAYLFRDFFNWATVVGGFLVTLVLIFVNAFIIEPTNSAFVIVVFDLLFGAAWGVTLGGFAIAVAESKGKRHLLDKAIGLTLGVMAIATICAAGIGLLTGFNFQGWNGVMFFGLLLLIGISTLAIFVRFNRVTEWIVGVAASIFWVIYLVIDFNRVVTLYNESSWSAAQSIAVQIYADLVNLFIWLLPLILDALDD